MKNIIKIILMLCVIFSGAFCFAHVEAETSVKEDGIPIEVVEKASYGGLDKSNSIIASIDGHYLSIVFTENLGQVSVEVTTITGGPVETVSMTTPNGQVLFIALTGDYIVNFTLPNGDEYYGEFSVTD